MIAEEKIVNYLEEKYHKRVTFIEYLVNKYGSLNDKKQNVDTLPLVEKKVVENNFSATFEEYLCFTCDEEKNLNIIVKLIKSAEAYGVVMPETEDSIVALKIFNNYKKCLLKIIEDNSLNEGEKVAADYVKVIKKTILKLLGNSKYAFIKETMLNDMIHFEEFEIGHRLSDEDFELLDENLSGIYSVKNEDETEKYKVFEMVQPIIKIYFEDEDGDKSYKFVPGICKFYV